MNMTPGREDLDELLDASSPPTTPITAEVAAEISRLRSVTLPAPGRRGPRRWARPVGVTLAAVALLGGAASAAAATGLWTVPWAPAALTSFTYTLPSGAQCEQIIGNVTGSDPAQVEAVEYVYRSTDFDALLTDEAIAATITQRRAAGPGLYQNADGSTAPSGYGTTHYNADEEYSTAVYDIVVTAVYDELSSRGIEIGSDVSYQSQWNCPGADW